ncbi:MAG: DUF3562 domain-containing protein [Betaproteobacteria bacterium]|nr:DUF3562 domain-containing protein [Betaproteobacteria bacterium]
MMQIEQATMPLPNAMQANQERIVARLASECDVPIGEMATLYEHERAELALGAHLTKFLHVFATRNVLELLRLRAAPAHLVPAIKTRLAPLAA